MDDIVFLTLNEGGGDPGRKDRTAEDEKGHLTTSIMPSSKNLEEYQTRYQALTLVFKTKTPWLKVLDSTFAIFCSRFFDFTKKDFSFLPARPLTEQDSIAKISTSTPCAPLSLVLFRRSFQSPVPAPVRGTQPNQSTYLIPSQSPEKSIFQKRVHN